MAQIYRPKIFIEIPKFSNQFENKACLWESSWQKVSFVPGNGFTLNMQQAIIWCWPIALHIQVTFLETCLDEYKK